MLGASSSLGVGRPARLAPKCAARPVGITLRTTFQSQHRAAIVCSAQAEASAPSADAASSPAANSTSPAAKRFEAAPRRRPGIAELKKTYDRPDTIIVSEDGDPVRLAKVIVGKHLSRGLVARLVVSSAASNFMALAALAEAQELMRQEGGGKGVRFQPVIRRSEASEGLLSNFRSSPALLFVEAFDITPLQAKLKAAADATEAPSSDNAELPELPSGGHNVRRVGGQTRYRNLAAVLTNDVVSAQRMACVSLVGTTAALTGMKAVIHSRFDLLKHAEPVELFVVPELRRSVGISKQTPSTVRGKAADSGGATGGEASPTTTGATSSGGGSTDGADAGPTTLDVMLLHVVQGAPPKRPRADGSTSGGEGSPRAGREERSAGKPERQQGAKAATAPGVAAQQAGTPFVVNEAGEQMISVPLKEWHALQSQLDLMTKQHSELLSLLTSRLKQ